jgi:hypothetical protein
MIFAVVDTASMNLSTFALKEQVNPHKVVIETCSYTAQHIRKARRQTSSLHFIQLISAHGIIKNNLE